MTSRDFVYWLQGYFEINAGAEQDVHKPIPADHVEVIKRHLALVFTHEIDPSYGDKEHQEELQEVHDNRPQRPTVYRC